MRGAGLGWGGHYMMWFNEKGCKKAKRLYYINLYFDMVGSHIKNKTENKQTVRNAKRVAINKAKEQTPATITINT